MISFKNVCKSYDKNLVYNNFDLDLRENEITCILGVSGVGKTTILNMLSSLTDYEGEISGIPESISYIFQQEKLLNNLTVRQNLEYVLKKEDFSKIDDILKKVELFDKRNKYPDELSGGERKRVEIARAFVYPSSLLLMDEPFSSLDTALKIRLVDNFVKLWKDNPKTTVFVTHDVEMATMLSNRIIIINNGQVSFDVSLVEPLPRKYGDLPQIKESILQKIL